MSRNTDISICIRLKQLFNSPRRPLINRLIRLSERRTPQRIILCKPFFERPIPIMAMNYRLTTPPIARMCTDDFSERFLDGRDERMFFRKVKSGECEAGCSQAAEERTRVVGFWGRDFLVGDLGTPEGVGFFGLPFSYWCEESVGPSAG